MPQEVLTDIEHVAGSQQPHDCHCHSPISFGPTPDGYTVHMQDRLNLLLLVSGATALSLTFAVAPEERILSAAVSVVVFNVLYELFMARLQVRHVVHGPCTGFLICAKAGAFTILLACHCAHVYALTHFL